MRVAAWGDAVLLRQRGHLFPWSPVFLALGIAAYFALPDEPGRIVYALLGGVGLVAALAAWRRPCGWSALGWAVALMVAGFCLAGLRANLVSAPVLGWRYYGPVEGRVVGLDRSASDKVRVTLDRVSLEDVPPWRTPERVRLSLHGPEGEIRPGARIRTIAFLVPPQGPAEPGGFDFRRHAWFKRLGAVGYTRKPVEEIAPAEAGRPGTRILALRLAISARIRGVLPGEAGGFAAAVTTGDRSGVGQETLRALRGSNLAHLLAISGLHMGLLAGFVLGALRFLLSLVPALALRLPVRKLAAAGALFAAGVYYLLSGGNVATERAFVMTAVMLGAVMVDRRAISLRAVAVAALIVLSLRPESLLGPGFQMSFAATTALVAVFGWLREGRYRVPRRLRPVGAVVLSSLVAGAATAPYGAAAFNTFSNYGLIANLLSVPVMGMLVIPAAVLALGLAPFGLEEAGLALMGLGVEWIMAVARTISGLEGAQGHVVSPGSLVLPLISLGALWGILWQGRARWGGAVPVLAGFLLWSMAERPTVLVADNGGLVGVMTPQGRALSKPRGAGFVARIWLENDGDPADQIEAAARWAQNETANGKRIRRMTVGGIEIVHLIGKRAVAAFGPCVAGQIVVTSVPARIEGPCPVYDSRRLRRTGSLAINGDGAVTTAREISAGRLWHRPTPDRRRFRRRDLVAMTQ